MAESIWTLHPGEKANGLLSERGNSFVHKVALEYQAALRGLQFVRVEQNPARYELQPMEPEQIEAFIEALLSLFCQIGRAAWNQFMMAY